MEIRRAVPEEAVFLAETRIRQLLDEGSTMVYDTRQEMTDFFERKIKSGEYMQLIGTVDGEFTCTAGLLFQEYPPSISWKGAKRGYICNVYTRPEYRKKGYASILIKELIKEARQRDLGNLWLMASKEGRTLYKTLGFDDIREGHDVYMEWYEE